MPLREPKPRSEHPALVVYYGLVGNNNNVGNGPYRPDNPWQTLKGFLDHLGPADPFAIGQGITESLRIDRGGSVFKILLDGRHRPEDVARAVLLHIQGLVSFRAGDRVGVVCPHSDISLGELVLEF